MSSSHGYRTGLDQASDDLIQVAHGDNVEDKKNRIKDLVNVIKSVSDKSQLIISYELLKSLRLMLVDHDKTLRVQTVRAMRYLTCNQLVLTQMVGLNIPVFMMFCLEREDPSTKYYWERLGALKWIRHLIEHFPLSIPKPVVMSLIGIACNAKHEYRRICLDSLREVAIINPQIVSQCNGFKTLIELILHPTLTDVSHSLLLTVLYILDHPNTRKYLRPSLDVQRLLRPFVDVNPYKKNALNKQQIEQRNKTREIAANTLMTMLKSVTGIFYLGGEHHGGIGPHSKYKGGHQSFIRIMVDLLKLPNEMAGIQWARHQMMDVLEHALLPLSDSSKLERIRGPNLMVNYVCLILMALIRNNLIECLVDVGMRSDLKLAPRARTLLQRIQFLSAKYLPPAICSRICSIETVIADAATFQSTNSLIQSALEVTVQRNFANMMISELTEDANADLDGDDKYIHPGHDFNGSDDDDSDREDEENRINLSAQTVCHQLGPQFDLNSTFIRYRYMLDRDIPSTMMFRGRMPYHSHRNKNTSSSSQSFNQFSFKTQRSSILEDLKKDQNASYSENQIMDKIRATNVLTTRNADEWHMDALWNLLNGPLWNVLNLKLAIKKQFIKNVMRFIKPSEQFFCLYKWQSDKIRYAQCAVQLFRLMTSCPLGANDASFKECVEEIFDCLKDQIEANLKKTKPKKAYLPFSREAIRNKLSRVYIVLIGVLSESERGMELIRKTGIFSFLFPLTKREVTEYGMTDDRIVGPNDYLLRLIGTNLDYTWDGEFPLLFSQWIAKGSYYLRKTLINHLELLYRAQMPKFDEWSIGILSMLLKSEQRLALTALKVLEKINLSQNSIKSHQYLVDLIRTQPTDEVIGQYGQFLFIKMLSTVEGLQFLDGKWLSRKRKEWHDKMHTKYTNMLETALVLSVSNESANDIEKQKDDQRHQHQNHRNLNNHNNHHQQHHHHQHRSNQQRGKPRLGRNDDRKSDENENELFDDEDAEQWLPYHLIYENRSDEEELYAEYLTHFPWSLRVKIYSNGTEEEIKCDAFFDSNCFYYKNLRSPVSLGQGVHGIILDQYGASSPLLLAAGSKIEITLDLGHECLQTLYGKKSLTKIVSVSGMTHYNGCKVIAAPELGLYCFFDEFNLQQRGLSRIFWSLDESIGTKLKQNSLVRPLPHFYGELAKTMEGCTYILSHHEFNSDLQTFILTVHSAFCEMMAMKGVDRRSDETPGNNHGDFKKRRMNNDNNDDDDDDEEKMNGHHQHHQQHHQQQNNNNNNKGGPVPDTADYTDNFSYDSRGGLVDNNSNLDLRSCLWALGQIGSSKTGLRLLNSLCNEMNDINIIDDICILTKASQTLSTRGTCLYVLGLLSRTTGGMQQLSKHGFGFPADNLELDLAVAIPEDIDDFFEMATTHYVQSSFLRPGNLRIFCTSPPELCRPGNMKPMDPNELMGKQGRTEETVLAHISSLCNNVTQKSSASALHRLRTKKPPVFSNPLLFREALKLLNQYQFKLAAKRFVVFTLFNDVILEEGGALDLFDASLEEPILPFKEIREWRFQFKKSLQRRQHSKTSYRAPTGHHGHHDRRPQHGGSLGSHREHQQQQRQRQRRQPRPSPHQQHPAVDRNHFNNNTVHQQQRQHPHQMQQPSRGPRSNSRAKQPPPQRQKQKREPQLFQVQAPEALPDDEEEPSENVRNGPPPGSMRSSPAPPPMKTTKNVNRVFDSNQFGKQKSVDRYESGMAPKPPPKRGVTNRAFPSKSDATMAHSPTFKKQQKLEKEQKEQEKQTTKPPLMMKRSNSSATVGTSTNTKLKKRPNLAHRTSYDKPLPARQLKDRNSQKRDSLKLNPNRKISSGILNRVNSLNRNHNDNNNGGAFTGNYAADQELADSPTDEVAGPNPLQNLPSQNQYQ